MLTRRTPMKSTGFKPRAPRHEPRDPDRVRRAPTVVPGAFRAPEPVASAPAARVEKSAPVRSEAYRRLVASLPCIHCGIEGYSQHAHENAGKGKSMKADDRCAMPLCCTRPGIEGCHAAFDQYRLLPGGREAHHAKGRAWAKKTRNQIQESGQWPMNLPMWRE